MGSTVQIEPPSRPMLPCMTSQHKSQLILIVLLLGSLAAVGTMLVLMALHLE